MFKINPKRSIVLLLVHVLGTCWAGGATADDRLAAPSIPTADVIVTGGVLQGRLVDSAGQPIAHQPVELITRTGNVTTAQTSVAGEFQFAQATQDAALLRAGSAAQIVRTWTTRTAPPNAITTPTLVVQSNQVTRGNGGGGSRINPVWLGLGSVAAAGIVIGATSASGGDDDDSSNGNLSGTVSSPTSASSSAIILNEFDVPASP